jgi:hypothetical protein
MMAAALLAPCLMATKARVRPTRGRGREHEKWVENEATEIETVPARRLNPLPHTTALLITIARHTHSGGCLELRLKQT